MGVTTMGCLGNSLGHFPRLSHVTKTINEQPMSLF